MGEDVYRDIICFWLFFGFLGEGLSLIEACAAHTPPLF